MGDHDRNPASTANIEDGLRESLLALAVQILGVVLEVGDRDAFGDNVAGMVVDKTSTMEKGGRGQLAGAHRWAAVPLQS